MVSIRRVAHELDTDRAALVILSAGSLAMLVLLIFVGRWLTFWTDEWAFILVRRHVSAEVLLAPHVDHLSTVPVLLYQGRFLIFGLESYFPYIGVSWALHFGSVALLFVIVRRTAGPLIGLAAALSLVFLGSAFEVLLHAFQTGFLLSTAFGLLAITLLQRPGPSIAQTGCAAAVLIIAAASSSVGVLFLGLVLAWALVTRDRSRLLSVLPALGLYAAWYVTWGRSGADGVPPISLTDIPTLALTFLFGLGAPIAAIGGAPAERFAFMGLGIGVTALAMVAWLKLGRFSALGLAALLALLAEYGLQALFRWPFGIEHAARSGYLYPGAIFIWIAAADILATALRPRLREPLFFVGAAVLLGLMIWGNMAQFVGAARAMRVERLNVVAQLRLVEALATSEDLNREASVDPELLLGVAAGPYLDAAAELGEPHLAIPEPRWDSLGPVDPARLDRALRRLLEGSFAAGSPNSLAPPAVRTEGARQVMPVDGCIRLEAGPAGAKATWIPGKGGLLVRTLNHAPDDVIRLTVFAEPGSAEDPRVGTLTATERRIALPTLPDDLKWTVTVVVPPHGVADVCDAAYGD